MTVTIDSEGRFSWTKIRKGISQIALRELDELFCVNPDYITDGSSKNKIV